MKNIYEVIVIGAGHAGLSISYFFKEKNLDHLVLECGQIGQSWLSQRWDSFQMNTANKLNTLPGAVVNEPNGFGSATAFAKAMKDFAATHSLPVRTGVKVVNVEKDLVSSDFVVTCEQEGRKINYRCRQLVVASGSQNNKRISPISAEVNSTIHQLHSSEYRNPLQLPDGDVLVVGSGQSGCQIAEDLVAVGKKVYLSTSMVPRCPRHYRGKDTIDWLIQLGFFNVRPEEIPDPAMLKLRTPLLKGTDGGKTSLSLQALHRKGVVLVGKLDGVSGQVARFTNDVADKLEFADGFSQRVKGMIDGFILEHNLMAPDAVAEPEDEPDLTTNFSNGLTSINLNKNNIATIIWANGFTFDFSYLKLPVFDEQRNPIHQQGTSSIDGLYFLGLHWLINRKSDILFGVKDDARSISDCIYANAIDRSSNFLGTVR